mmetsp:Transcript_20750/g.43611  ORF Transcript_20750/g.43611 Transcript_20750/m.43611 type:complete len:119 (+) Transcript_20750:83-439(+)
MRSFLFVSLAILVTLALSGVRGFSPSHSIIHHRAAEWRTASAFTHSSSSSCSPTSSSLTLANRDDDDRRVRVDLIEDIDPITLTAVGFGLIAFNFFVLGNLGDGGIGGFVARIINTFG